MGEGERRVATPHQACTGWGPDFADPWDVHAVSAATDIPAPTLRTWDRRHGIGPSLTVDGGRRRYSCNDVDGVVVMAHHVRQGSSPTDAAETTHAVGKEQLHRLSRELA